MSGHFPMPKAEKFEKMGQSGEISGHLECDRGERGVQQRGLALRSGGYRKSLREEVLQLIRAVEINYSFNRIGLKTKHLIIKEI